MSAGGLAISVANFATAVWEDPQDFRDAHCSNHVAEVAVETCSPYKRIDWGVATYFFLGCLTLVACSFGYAYIFHVLEEEKQGKYDVVATTVEASPRIGLELRTRQRNDEVLECDEDTGLQVEHEDGIFRVTDQNANVDALEMQENANDASFREIVSAVWAPVLSVFLAFVVTLGLFPAWTSQLRSVHECHGGRLNNDLYLPFSFVVFNAGDLIGRILSARITESQIRNLSPKLLLVALARFGFFLLFIFCAAANNRSFIVPSDFYSLVVQAAFSVSSGCLISTCFVHAGSLVNNTGSRVVSELLNLAVSVGLLAGSMLSFPVVKLLSGSA